MRRPNRLEVRRLHQDRRHEHAQKPLGKILAFLRNMDQVTLHFYSLTLADPGGPRPTGSNSFVFAYIFGRKRPCQRLAAHPPPPPQRVGAPDGKSWIRHCLKCRAGSGIQGYFAL